MSTYSHVFPIYPFTCLGGAKYCAYIFSTSPTTTLIKEVYGGEEEVDDSTFAYDSDDAAPVKRVAEYLALNRRKRKAEDNRIEQLQMELEECKNREQQEGASKLSTQASSCRPRRLCAAFGGSSGGPVQKRAKLQRELETLLAKRPQPEDLADKAREEEVCVCCNVQGYVWVVSIQDCQFFGTLQSSRCHT